MFVNTLFLSIFNILVKESIANAMVNYVKTPEGKEVFHAMYGVTALERATDSRYDGVRDMLKTLGKSAQDLANKK